MSEGKSLAIELRTKMTAREISFADRVTEEERDAYLIGKFERKHSRIALYNASANWKD